ncbi:uncharacterized protein FMAN_15385 [Fusarium mangiferae]|uniref:Uncharacterized protein n=1 Tax=Fusarium mangiferae TaxID=192010 RepID=A0A1L7UII5_FUSMA|nr:uncharacterized protein FMAN_15385 [Fusarium mangiferae]CVL07311.1 uncharacterized protein FMAN_15385 [Fusarium mangiferae]
MEAPYRFRVIDAYNYTYDTPEPWQAWHEAYFRRISSVLGANGEPVRLKDDGCTMPEYTTPNCTRTCSNATSMFYSESNVWNCIALATVSIQVLQGNKSFDEENVALMDQRFNLGGSDLRAIDQLGIFAQVRGCFSQSCEDSKFGSCTPKFKPYRSRPINASNIHEFANITNGPYCQSTSLGIDSDIAGPGILVSYMMLLSLVLLLSVLFCLFGLYGIKAREETTEPSDSSQKPRKKVQSLIINLQEAQGSFVFTVSLVYLIAFDGNTVGLSNIGTLLSYVINRNIGYGLMIIGTFSVAFLHYFACKSGMHQAESLFLVLSNMTMLARAHYTYTKGSWAKPERFLGSLRKNAKLEKCGNNPGPMSFCLGAQLRGLTKTQQTFALTKKMVYAVYVLCTLLLIDDTVRFLRKRRPDSQIYRWVSFAFYPLLFAGLTSLIIGLIDLVAAFHRIKELNGGEHSWSFGQFVAVSVWGPMALKLIGALLSMIGAWGPFQKASIGANSHTLQRAKDFLSNHSSQESISDGINGRRFSLLHSPGISMADLGVGNGSNNSNEALQGSGLRPTQPSRNI